MSPDPPALDAEAAEELLRELTDLAAPTGQEDEVTSWLEREWAGRGTVSRSAVGNITLHIGGTGPRLVVSAHADELSMIVRSVTPEGFLRVLPGERDSWLNPVFLGSPVRVLGDGNTVPGVFATTTGHVATQEQRERTRITWDDVFVDVGLDAVEVRERGIRVGTRMVWDAPLRRVGRLLVGKALDDRIGIAVLVLLARRLVPGRLRYDVTLAATVQEEIGFLGSASLAAQRFDAAVIVDNGLAGDIPTVSESHMPVRLGAGPALVHRDSSAHFSRRLLNELRGRASTHNLPVQDAVLYHYASEGGWLIRQGVETALLAPPIRYSHSPFEAVDPADLVTTTLLLHAFLTEPFS